MNLNLENLEIRLDLGMKNEFTDFLKNELQEGGFFFISNVRLHWKKVLFKKGGVYVGVRAQDAPPHIPPFSSRK